MRCRRTELTSPPETLEPERRQRSDPASGPLPPSWSRLLTELLYRHFVCLFFFLNHALANFEAQFSKTALNYIYLPCQISYSAVKIDV